MNLKSFLKQHIDVFNKSAIEFDKVQAVAVKMLETFRLGRKILIAGNGGSAADAQHFAAELVGRFECNRDGLSAIALTTDTSVITAISNDFGYNSVFSRQVKALGKTGDMFFGISASGRSTSILDALSTSQQIGMSTVLLTGASCNFENADHIIAAQSSSIACIQEFHIFIIHCLCRLVDREL